MSYAVQRALGDLTSVDVGKRAFSDPVLAKASLDASDIMLAMAKVTAVRRLPLMQASLERLGVDASDVVEEMRRGLARRDENPDQVAFDAMRLAIANTRMDRGIDNARQRIASRSGWDSLIDAGLGTLSANDRATGCMIAAGASTVGSLTSLVPVYGTIIGGIISIGSGVAGGQLDCGREAREAAANAAAAQEKLAATRAAVAAAEAEAAATARQRQIRTLAVGGAILLAVLGAGWVILD